MKGLRAWDFGDRLLNEHFQKSAFLLRTAIAVVLLVAVGRGQESKPGVVVVSRNTVAEKADIREGDVIDSWIGGDGQGQIESPLDLYEVQIEQEPRGPVTLYGSRGGEKRIWALDSRVWDIESRPNFQGALLNSYNESQVLIKAERLLEAAARLREIAIKEDRPSSHMFGPWLFFRRAELLSKARQWKEANDTYMEGVQKARSGSCTCVVVLLRAWAASFEQQNDWAKASNYYKQAADESRKSNATTLTLARSLSDLGRMAENRGEMVSANDYYIQALSIAEKLAPASLNVAREFNNLGRIARVRGESEKAESYHRQALTIYERLDRSSVGRASSLNNLGTVAWQQGDLAKAEDYYSQALTAYQEVAPDSHYVMSALNNLGIIAMDQGDFAKAEDRYRKALSIGEKLNPAGHEMVGNLINLGTVAVWQGDLAKAEDCYRKALAISQKIAPNGSDTAASLNNLGNVAWQRGDFKKAQGYYLQALAINRRVAPDSLDVATTLNNLGSIAYQRADLAKAEDYSHQALEISQKIAPDSADVSASLDTLGNIAYQRGDLNKAEEYFQQVRHIREKLSPENLDFAEILNQLGDMAYDKNDLASAELLYRQALTIRERIAPGSAAEAETLASLAAVVRRSGNLAFATDLYRQALEVLESQVARLGGSEDVRANFRSKHAAYYRDYIDLLVTQHQSKLAFEVLERSRARTLLETLAAAHIDIRKDVDAGLLARERSLQAKIAAKSGRRAQLLSEKEIKNAEQQLAVVNQEITDLISQYGDVEGQIRSSSPVYAALSQPRPLSAKEVQEQLLDPETVLLEYSLGQERSYVFVVTQESIVTYELPKEAEIEAAARRVYDLLTVPNSRFKGEAYAQRQVRVAQAKSEYPRAATRLSRMVLAPVTAQLSYSIRTPNGKRRLKGRRLLVVCDGALHYVPFAALQMPKHPGIPLIAEHEIINLPSASVLALLRQQRIGRKKATRTVAVLADPVFDSQDVRVAGDQSRSGHDHEQPRKNRTVQERDTQDDFSSDQMTRSAADVSLIRLPRLQKSREEGRSILKTVPVGQGMLALDFQASRATAIAPDLAQYRIVHFATHGLLNSKHPELSGLVLSLVNKDGMPQNGFLGLQDIYNLNLPVDLVVLSACQTALGKNIQGEGVVGLTRGFMYAGATRLVASLWAIDDLATAELMASFYKSMEQQGMGPVAALRAAQIGMWRQKRWSSPYYWAAFQIQGEWR